MNLEGQATLPVCEEWLRRSDAASCRPSSRWTGLGTGGTRTRDWPPRVALRRFARTPRVKRRAVPMRPETRARLLFPVNLLLFHAFHRRPRRTRCARPCWGGRRDPTIDFTDDELAAVAAAIRRAIEDDQFPHAPRLDPLRAALANFDATPELTPLPTAPPPKSTSGRAAKSLGKA